ncbi:MAG: hypothetical protein H0W96_06335 [Solirubrobacterales bacterium]|nr:hypothetical protein [Solirubrobacterales bacterium]
MTSAAGATRTQRADFYDGIFQIRQGRATQPVTDILLMSGSYLAGATRVP